MFSHVFPASDQSVATSYYLVARRKQWWCTVHHWYDVSLGTSNPGSATVLVRPKRPYEDADAKETSSEYSFSGDLNLQYAYYLFVFSG